MNRWKIAHISGVFAGGLRMLGSSCGQHVLNVVILQFSLFVRETCGAPNEWTDRFVSKQNWNGLKTQVKVFYKSTISIWRAKKQKRTRDSKLLEMRAVIVRSSQCEHAHALVGGLIQIRFATIEIEINNLHPLNGLDHFNDPDILCLARDLPRKRWKMRWDNCRSSERERDTSVLVALSS